MSWLYTPAQVEDFSAVGSSDSGLSATLRMTPTASASSEPGSRTATLTMPRSGTMPEHSTGDPGLDSWMSSLRASPASPSASPADGRGRQTSGTSGRTRSASYAKWDPASACWRTSQVCLLTTTLAPYSGSWPQAGSMRSGECYRRPRLEHRTYAGGSGYWPTPNVEDAGRQGDAEWAARWAAGEKVPTPHQRLRTKVLWPTPRAIYGEHPGMKDDQHLTGAVQMWPTPRAQKVGGYSSPRFRPTLEQTVRGISLEEAQAIEERIGGQLNPRWVEWLMGVPIGWVSCAPLAICRFREWWQKHGGG